MAKAALKALKALSEESFVETHKTPAHTKAEMALEIVKYVIDAKQNEEDAARKRADSKTERAKLVEILAERDTDKLKALSEIALKKRIAALDAE